jgi:hypothetical protein
VPGAIAAIVGTKSFAFMSGVSLMAVIRSPASIFAAGGGAVGLARIENRTVGHVHAEALGHDGADWPHSVAVFTDSPVASENASAAATTASRLLLVPVLIMVQTFAWREPAPRGILHVSQQMHMWLGRI